VHRSHGIESYICSSKELVARSYLQDGALKTTAYDDYLPSPHSPCNQPHFGCLPALMANDSVPPPNIEPNNRQTIQATSQPAPPVPSTATEPQNVPPADDSCLQCQGSYYPSTRHCCQGKTGMEFWYGGFQQYQCSRMHTCIERFAIIPLRPWMELQLLSETMSCSMPTLPLCPCSLLQIIACLF
jgi:hypothetical protein